MTNKIIETRCVIKVLEVIKFVANLLINIPIITGSVTTKNILNNAEIELLPKHSIVINTSRGSTVDDEALIKALQNNKIYAAGLDVFINEPNVDERYLKLDNCFLLPHIGSSNYETRDAMSMMAVDNICAYFNNKPLLSKVN